MPYAQKHFALHPKFFKGYDCVEMNGEDGMHLFGDGLTQCKPLKYFIPYILDRLFLSNVFSYVLPLCTQT